MIPSPNITSQAVNQQFFSNRQSQAPNTTPQSATKKLRLSDVVSPRQIKCDPLPEPTKVSNTVDFFAGFSQFDPDSSKPASNFQNPQLSPAPKPNPPQKKANLPDKKQNSTANSKAKASSGSKQKTITEMFAFSSNKKTSDHPDVLSMDEDQKNGDNEEINVDDGEEVEVSKKISPQKQKSLHPPPEDTEQELGKTQKKRRIEHQKSKPKEEENENMDIENEDAKPKTSKKPTKQELVQEEQRKLDNQLILDNKGWEMQKKLQKEQRKFQKQEDDEERFMFLVHRKDKNKRTPDHPDFDPRTLYISAEDMAKLTGEFERQYWKIKKELMDVVLFFKKGKFYELYESDADLGRDLCALKMTNRVNMRMVGVPEQSFLKFANIFLANGHKIARTEQIGEVGEKENKNAVVPRALVEIISPGVCNNPDLVGDGSRFLMAIKEVSNDADGKSANFGICFVDASENEFYVCRFEDDENRTFLETLLHSVAPKELILEKGGVSKRTELLISNSGLDKQINYLKSNYDYDYDRTIRAIEEEGYFMEEQNENNGNENENPKKVEKWPPILEKYRNDPILMSSVGAVFSYLKYLKKDREIIKVGAFNEYSLKEDDRGKMILDCQTIKNLELLQNSDDHTENSTLLKKLNRCVTPFGKRMFRTELLHPLRNRNEIEQRYNAAEDFQKFDGLSVIFSDTLTKAWKMPDLQRLLSRLHSICQEEKAVMFSRDFNKKRIDVFRILLIGFRQMMEFIKEMGKSKKEYTSTTLKRYLCIKPVYHVVDPQNQNLEDEEDEEEKNEEGNEEEQKQEDFYIDDDGKEVPIPKKKNLLEEILEECFQTVNSASDPQRDPISAETTQKITKLLEIFEQNVKKRQYFPDLGPILKYFDDNFEIVVKEEDKEETWLEPVGKTGIQNEEFLKINQQIDECDKKMNDFLQKLRKRDYFRDCAEEVVIVPSIGRKESDSERFFFKCPSKCRDSVDKRETIVERKGTLKGTKGFYYFVPKEIEHVRKQRLRAESARKFFLQKFYLGVFRQLDALSLIFKHAVRVFGNLDVLYSIFKASFSDDHYNRPKILPKILSPGQPRIMRVKNLFHPLLEVSLGQNLIPNDTYLNAIDPMAGRYVPGAVVVTGPNMGGKSSLLRQVCIAVIMAQIGCRVPAEEFEFHTVDRIFTRIGANDRIMAGESTFMVELSETSSILKNATENSLVILDELGRGTSTNDGQAIAMSTLLYLAEIKKCRTLFSTHYHWLYDQLKFNPFVEFYRMGFEKKEKPNPISSSSPKDQQSESEIDDIIFTFRFERGVVDDSYGIFVAKLAHLNVRLVQFARKIKDVKQKKEKEFEQEFFINGKDHGRNLTPERREIIGRYVAIHKELKKFKDDNKLSSEDQKMIQKMSNCLPELKELKKKYLDTFRVFGNDLKEIPSKSTIDKEEEDEE